MTTVRDQFTAQKLRNHPARNILRVSNANAAHGVRVDRDADNRLGGKGIIYGAIMAQLGPFKSQGRGAFDLASLNLLLGFGTASPNGTKTRLAHPDESHDGVDKTLGRWFDHRLDSVADRDSEGVLKTDLIPCLRADIHISPAADKGPFKMGDYLLTLAETDPDSISSSVVISTDREPQLDSSGKPMLGADGETLPDLWRPTALMACDIVSTGDAVDGLLAKSGGSIQALSSLPNGLAFLAESRLNDHFAGKSQRYVERHATAFLAKYLTRRYGPNAMSIVAALADGDDTDDGDRRDGAADATDNPGDIPEGSGEPKELHDGCRSTLAYHHQTLCRLCGGTIQACGCDNVAKESRVVTMAKEPCADCQAKLAMGEDSGDAQPEGEPAGDRPDNEMSRRLAALLE